MGAGRAHRSTTGLPLAVALAQPPPLPTHERARRSATGGPPPLPISGPQVAAEPLSVEQLHARHGQVNGQVAAGSQLAAVRSELEMIRQQLDDLLAERTQSLASNIEPPSLRAELEETKRNAAQAQAENVALSSELECLRAVMASAGLSEGRETPKFAAADPGPGGPLGGLGAACSRSLPQKHLSSDPASLYLLTLENVLDTFQPCGKFLPVLRCALQRHSSTENRARDVAEQVASVGPADLSAVLPVVRENLQLVGPITSALEVVLYQVLDLHAGWKFDGTGRADLPPAAPDPHLRGMTLTQEEMSMARRLVFPHVPPQLLDYGRVQSLRERQFAGPKSEGPPTVIVTVGSPGSGKSSLLETCAQFLQENFRGPPYAQYVHVDPDYFIGHLFEFNNAYRDAANFCNHESLLTATGQRRHILFDHVGRDLMNTCGRCITRFREAGYRIYICVVLATYSTCQRRIRQRLQETGRDVPDAFLRMAFKGLNDTVPVMIQQQAHLADAVLVYDNDPEASAGTSVSVRLVRAGADSSETLAFARRMLELPPAEA